MTDTGEKKLDPPVQLPPCSAAIERIPPDDYGDFIKVVVGQGANVRPFFVYRGWLLQDSSYFRRALKNEWKEGSTRTVELPEDEPEVFRAFFHWASTKKLFTNLKADGSIPFTFRFICKVYVFGDARGIPGLCNAAVDLLFQACVQRWTFPSEQLNYIYQNTPEECQLQKFVVAYAVASFSWANIKINKEIYPKDFLLDAIESSRNQDSAPGKGAATKTQFIAKMKADMCSKYHDHSCTSRLLQFNS